MERDKIIKSGIPKEILYGVTHPKYLEEYLAEERFKVNGIEYNPFIFIGEERRNDELGMEKHTEIPRYTLEVSPLDEDVPVRRINYDGKSIVNEGDYVFAQLLNYSKAWPGGWFYDFDIPIYQLKELGREETANKISVLHDNKVINEAYSMHYSTISKK